MAYPKPVSAIHLDLFPCEVATPHGTHSKARVLYVQSDGERPRVHVFTAPDGRNLVESATADVPVVPMENRWPYVFTTVDGETWTVTRSTGCGCGHPGKRARFDALMALASTP